MPHWRVILGLMDKVNAPDFKLPWLWREAIVWSQQGLEVARTSEAENVEGILLNNLGTALANLGEVQRAIDLHEWKLILARDTQDRDSEKNALLNRCAQQPGSLALLAKVVSCC
jgi:hypothetical protein